MSKIQRLQSHMLQGQENETRTRIQERKSAGPRPTTKPVFTSSSPVGYYSIQYSPQYINF